MKASIAPEAKPGAAGILSLIEHDRLSVEVKARASFPAWLEDALRQAEVSAMDGKTPAVVLHPDRKPYRDALVVLRLSEFAELVRAPGKT